MDRERLRRETPVFNAAKFQDLLDKYAAKELPLNLAQELLKEIHFTVEPSSWIGIARRTDRSISLGLDAIPLDTVRRWGWGVESAADQVHVKASHEYAHFIQDFFDRDLTKFLDRKFEEVREQSHAYLQLYTVLSEIGRISGLPEEKIYERQNQEISARGGHLDMRIYEDMAEMIGAWMLGDDYYNFRLDHSVTPLTHEQKEDLTKLIWKVFETWALLKSAEENP